MRYSKGGLFWGLKFLGFGRLIRFMGYIFVAWSNCFNTYFSVLVIYLKSSKLVDSYCEIAGYAFKNEAHCFITNKYLQWNLPYGGKGWWGETLVNWLISSIWQKKVWQNNRSTSRLSIISTNLDGFSLANHGQFANVSSRQSFPPYGTF